MNLKKIIFLVCTLTFFGCLPFKNSELKVTTPIKKTTIQNVSISSVQIINHQLIITGKNLDSATTLKVSGTSFDESFTIESQSTSQIIANSMRAFSFDVSKVFNLIISSANASATFPIDFSICNSTLNGKAFNCSIGASDKDVLSYDAVTQTWKPRPATSGLNYLGAFDASSNPSNGPTPYPASGAYYIISQDGLIGATNYLVGDWMVSNGSAWQKIDNSTLVQSVFNRTGNITAQEGDYELDQLLDVDLPGPIAAGKVLKYDGSHWVAADDLSSGGAGSVDTTAIANGAVTDAKIATVSASKITGTITSTQILDGTIVNADINSAAAIDYSKLNIPNTTIPYAKLNIANGDIPAAKISGLPSATAVLATTITDGDTTHAPDGNSVHDALALKLNMSGGALTSAGTISNVPDPVSPDDVSNRNYTDTKVAKSGGTMTGDLDLDAQLKLKGSTNYVTIKSTAATTAYSLTLPATAGTSGYVLSTDGNGVLSWISVGSPATGSLTTDQQAAVTIDPFGSSAGNTGEIRLKELAANGTNYIALKSPDTIASNHVFIMPATAGSNGDVLTSNGSNPATLSWTTPTSGTSAALTGDIGGTVGANTIGSGKVTLTHLSATGTKDNTTYLRGDNTWATFGSGILATPLTSLSLATGAVISAADTILSAIGKLQKQITDIPAQPAAPTGTADATTYHAGDNTWKSFGSNVRGTVLTGLDSTGINYASRAIASTDSALVAFNKMLFTQGDYVSKSSNQTIYGSLKINSLTGFIEVPDPIGVSDATNKQYVDSSILALKTGTLIPAGKVILMDSCPSGWINHGQESGTPDAAQCGAGLCYQCEASVQSLIPANAITLTESCPADWTYLGKTPSGQTSAGVNNILYSMCRAPAIASGLPAGTKIFIDSCPTNWKLIGAPVAATRPSAKCLAGVCKSCQVPGSQMVADIYSPPTEDVTGVGIPLYLVAGIGGSTSGVGGEVIIKSGSSNSGTTGNVSISSADATAGNSGNVNISSGLPKNGNAGSINLNANNGETNGNGGNVNINSGAPAGTGTRGYVLINSAGPGNVGIGTTTPLTNLDVNGTIKSVATSNSSATIDFATGNLQYTSVNCGAMNLNNMKSGATYTLSVQGTGGGTCAFSAYTGNLTGGLTVKVGPASLAQTAGKHTLFTFMVMGSFVYVASIDGY